jgi:plastocyanin
VRRLLPLIPLSILLAACGGSGGGEGGGASSGAQTIQISEKEYSLNPSAVTVSKPGTYTFEVTNDGQTTHAFDIEAGGGGEEAETGDIEPGQKKTVQFTVSAGQSYEMYCPIDGHRQQGMDGTVAFAGAPTGTTTNPEDDRGGEDDNNPGY